jgi:hypothetical protein
MKRYMMHLRNTVPYTAKEAGFLLHRARELVEPEATVRDARVSKKYLEFDITIPEDKDLASIVSRIEVISPLASSDEVTERDMEKDKAILRAVQLFNDERYWEAHESLEYVWKNAAGMEKELLNGIILVAAAFVHDQKDERDVCISILLRAKRKLEGTTDLFYYGIDIIRIVGLLSDIIDTGHMQRFTI